MDPNWRVLSGENKWEGLLVDPIGDDFRRYIIHYGEMAQATYDAYDSDENSITGGNSKYAMDELFSQVGLGKGRAKKNYTITKYLYTTAAFAPFNKDTNWMGYVAVSTDQETKEAGRRDIVVAWRGTNEESEWLNNVGILQQPASEIFGDIGEDDIPSVHGGFYLIYTSNNSDSTFSKISVRDQVLKEVSRLVSIYKNETISVVVTGHSLGGALTTLNAIDIARNVFKNQDEDSNSNLVTAFAFASPRIGGPMLRDSAASLKNLHILRIENKPDSVPDFPNIGYRDVGQLLFMDTEESEFLKRKGFIGSKGMAHNMEIYLHGVSGTQGVEKKFKKDVERDISLVNKHGENLVDIYGVPIAWWDEVDKAGMVQMEDGSWKTKLIINKKKLVTKWWKFFLLFICY
ncbi:phospholipase A1-IIbeta-like [Impatiens glandulifera]|uniref:phospholipase A1-IIbeta-like n=1 Tax=Impatiens glandulifera TaxID=253017 RepID=UPI001FB10D69|nr:phospholipase A1-IIbeta-like [Impatiens glandulifera]